MLGVGGGGGLVVVAVGDTSAYQQVHAPSMYVRQTSRERVVLVSLFERPALMGIDLRAILLCPRMRMPTVVHVRVNRYPGIAIRGPHFKFRLIVAFPIYHISGTHKGSGLPQVQSKTPKYWI